MAAPPPRLALAHHALVVLALLAVALKTLVPAGYMPGTSLAAPILLCPDQTPMPAMAHAHHGHHRPADAPHDKPDHPCAFAGVAAAAWATPDPGPLLAPQAPRLIGPLVAARALTPGHGLAAPPPPSHAPPTIRA